MSKVRCAIYTRKSSDEGLDQAFNSLDAQREACAAYILSQASEGWVALPTIYDDGGLSGGTLERPALKRLLADVAQGSIDIIVVYKVDRLTRSLFDFAKLVETFDTTNTSFVSITQSFNTTTSMGRLTLNMLLSFAQFEREVTAERIRDKIAASKARGMWMGGTPPLGYQSEGRSLAIVEDHAMLIRHIYARYLELGCVRYLVDDLHARSIFVPQRTRGSGAAYGGGRWSRGQIYSILKNPIYIGQIPHRDQLYEGRHPPIVNRDLWDRVQAHFASVRKGGRRARRGTDMSVLAGKLFDDQREPLIAAHAGGTARRYRYYVSRARHHREGDGNDPGLRIPAREFESAVAQRIGQALRDPLALVPTLATLPPTRVANALALATQLADRLAGGDHAPLQGLVADVTIAVDRIVINLSISALADGLQLDGPIASVAPLQCAARRARCGGAVRLVHSRDGAPTSHTPNVRLVQLIAKANRWWRRLIDERVTIATLAQTEGVGPVYVTRVLRLAFLAPDLVDDIVSGCAPPWVDVTTLCASGAIAIDWHVQRATLRAPRQAKAENVAYE